MKAELTYEEAVAHLEEIVKRAETNDLDIDRLAEELKEARKLLEFCKAKLVKAETQVKEMMDVKTDK